MKEEKKFETVSGFVSSMSKKSNYNMSNLPYILLGADQQFKNKDYLKYKVKNGLIKCENSLNDLTIKKAIFDFRKGYCKACEDILRLLEV